MQQGFVFSIAISILTAFLLSATACAQVAREQSANKNNVAVEFEYIYRAGETTVEAIDLKRIPNGSRLPNGYTLLGNQTFNIKTSAIVSGETIVSVKVPVSNKVEFQNVRILKLTSYELNPGGFEWYDCTIGTQKFPSGEGEEPSESDKQRRARVFPDFDKKQIACATLDGFEKDNYFALVLQTGLRPTEPATQITTRLQATKTVPENGETTYILSFTNTGKKSVSEVNFYSFFDDDSMIVVANPGQGQCEKAKHRVSLDSVVCHLGPLERGATTKVEFISRPSTMGGLARGRKNIKWLIEGFVKEHPDDSTQAVNKFTFETIASIGRE